MITIEIRMSDKGYTGFSSKGHAGYAEEGFDIICSAVSALTLNTINSIEEFTDDGFKSEVADGLLRWKFTDCPISKESQLLMDALVLGLENIRESYGKKYIKIVRKDLTK